MREAEAGRDIILRSLPGQLEIGVATPFWGRDLGCFGWTEGRSQHGIDVATWPVEIGVATPFCGCDLACSV